MQLEQMEIFYYVAQWNSFTRAADHLKLSKGYISKTITSLEKNLKMLLLNRTTRHVSLTPEGEMFFTSCIKVVEEKSYVLSQMGNLKAEPAGLLTISASPTITESIIIQLIPEFKKRFPKIRLNIDSSPIAKNLSQYNIDIALRLTNNPDENYIAKNIKNYNMVICATPEYLSRHGKPQKIEDLKNYEYLQYTNDPNSDLSYISNKKVIVNALMSSNNAVLIKKSLLNSLGFANLPEYYIKNELDNGLLESIFNNENKITLYAIYRSGINISNKVRAFLNFLNESLE